MFTPNSQIEQWIEEDVPGFDLTSHLLNMSDYPARLVFRARHDTVLCGCEECGMIFERLGATIEQTSKSGERVQQHQTFLSVKGDAAQLHAGWRVALNLLEYSSGIATRTASMVQASKQNGHAQICGTRKAFPGGRRISQKALIAGGGIHHRLGLGETILIFPNHYRFMGLDTLLDQLPDLKKRAPEKKIALEVFSIEEARKAVASGVDILQLDKFSPEEVGEVVQKIARPASGICVAAAGGINTKNAAEYASTGADLLVTSSMYFGKPADISAKMERL